MSREGNVPELDVIIGPVQRTVDLAVHKPGGFKETAVSSLVVQDPGDGVCYHLREGYDTVLLTDETNLSKKKKKFKLFTLTEQ